MAAGVGNGFGTAFLYRGLSSGRMGVVAPVSGVGAAVVPVVVGVAPGRAARRCWSGSGSCSPSRRSGWWPASPVRRRRRAAARVGVVDGILAGLGFGFLFVALAQIAEDAGLLPLAVNQVVAVRGHRRWSRRRCAQPWRARERAGRSAARQRRARRRPPPVCFLLATREGYLSVAAVVTSLYPAFTVLLAATVLREHVHRAQAVGLAAVRGGRDAGRGGLAGPATVTSAART